MKDQLPQDSGNTDNPGNGPGPISRRKAITGGIGGLLLGALSAKNAAAQSTAQPTQPLLQLGGVCEGTLLMLKPADATAFMQKMLAKSVPLQTLRNHFIDTQGMAFILSRAKVFMYTAPTLTEEAIPSPQIMGILPSFKPVNRSDTFHEAAGIVVHHGGGAMATSVRVSHDPFLVTEFRSHELDPEDNTKVITNTISALELERLSVQEAAAAMGTPKVFQRNVDPNSPSPSQADSTAMTTLALQTILKDSYARPLYPQEGLSSLLAQTSLVTKLSIVHSERYSIALGGALGRGFYCSCTCCNGCTTTSFTIDIRVA